jgi:hypothetical protein
MSDEIKVVSGRLDRATLAQLRVARIALVVTLALCCLSLFTASAQDRQGQAPGPGAMPQSLRDKMHQLGDAIQQLQERGTDPETVAELVQGVPLLIEQQKFAQAEAIVDRALKLAAELNQAGAHAPQKGAAPADPRWLFPRDQIWGILHVTIVDKETGRPAKARCYLTDSAGQTWTPSRAMTYVKPLETHFYADGEFRVWLPPGQYNLRVEHGTEYRSVTRNVDIRPARLHDEEIELARWINMNARGWYSGDLHNHRDLSDMPELLLAENLNLAPTLTTWIFGFQQMPIKQPAASDPAIRAVDATHAYSIFDTEIEGLGPASGAVGLVGLSSPLPIRTDQLTPLNSAYAKLAHRDGGYVDAEKITWRDGAALIALGEVDFVGLVYNSFTPHGIEPGWGVAPPQGSEYRKPANAPLWAMELYYKFLNSGFKLPVSAGTASGVKSVPLGYNRVYVHLPRGFGYRKWLQGLKAGRSFATNGPMLFLTVDGHEPGDLIDIPESSGKSPHRLRVHAEAISDGKLGRLQIVWKGQVIKTVDAAGDVQNLQANFEAEAPSSGWFAARAFEKPTETVRFAHTSPVYVRVGHENVRVAADARYLQGVVEEQIKFCESTPYRSEADRQAMLAFFRQAAAIYARLAGNEGEGKK